MSRPLQPTTPAIDGWSVIHFASGVGLAWLGVKPTLAMTSLIAFEVWEAGQRQACPTCPGGVFAPESDMNILADILIGAAGYFAFKKS